MISLGAIGVSLTFGILGFANFAHGDLMTFGAYCAFLFYSQLALPFWLAFPLALLATAALAITFDQLIFKRLRSQENVILLISSFGIALIIRACIQLIWGPDNQVYNNGIQMPYRFYDGSLRLKPDQMIILLITLGLMLALHLFLQKSKTGKAMRATADNPELARLTGINTERVIIWTWLLGGSLAAAAGIFLGMDTRLHSGMGWFLLLPIFAAAILGGIGHPYGAMVGGLIIGVVQELSTLIIAPNYKPAIAFSVMILMLIYKPTGLFGKAKV